MERTLFVKADAAQRFSVVFPLDVEQRGEFASFSGPEKARVVYDTGGRGDPRTRRFPWPCCEPGAVSLDSAPIPRPLGDSLSGVDRPGGEAFGRT